MTTEEFSQIVPGLSGMNHVEKIKHFGWFILTHKKRDRFQTGEIRALYDQMHYVLPSNIPQQCQQMSEKKPPDLLKDAQGYRLEGRVREQLDTKYGQRQATIVVDAMLQDLPGKVSDQAERLFLSEAITCYRNKAFRATIVMTWNVTYDHLLNWIFANHLAAFNTAIPVRFRNKAGLVITKKDQFADDLKESDVIEICGTASIINGNIKKILLEKLTKRNMAAHPSLIEVTQYQAEDAISDLVNNVILKLV